MLACFLICLLTRTDKWPGHTLVVDIVVITTATVVIDAYVALNDGVWCPLNWHHGGAVSLKCVQGEVIAQQLNVSVLSNVVDV
jgi:hypothetical protein